MKAPRALPILSVLALLLAFPVTATAKPGADGSKPAPKAVGQAVAGVPAGTLDAIGKGLVYTDPNRFQVFPLGGGPGVGKKVQVLTYNAAWCPHCAANSWPLAVALARFGTFGGLRTIDSGTYYAELGARPAYSHTKGLSFIDATYSSPLIDFAAVVTDDTRGKTVQKLTKAQKKMLRFDPEGAFPAIAIDQTYGFVGSGFSPGLLKGKSPLKIASGLADPANKVTRAIGGEANVLTAALCVATGQQPAAVCSSPGVAKAASVLSK